MVGITAVGMFAVGMMSMDIAVYEPVSKIGGTSTFTANPQPFVTVDPLVDDEGVVILDDESVILIDDL